MTGFIYVFYALLSAACYVGATFVMKYYDRLRLWQAGVLIVLLLGGAVVAEIVALRAERFALILLLILGAESALGLALGWGWFRESYSAKEMIGFVMIIAGMGLLKA